MVLISVAVALPSNALLLVDRQGGNASTQAALFTFLPFYLFTFKSAFLLFKISLGEPGNHKKARKCFHLRARCYNDMYAYH